MLDMGQAEQQINVFEFVNQMRHRRIQSVQVKVICLSYYDNAYKHSLQDIGCDVYIYLDCLYASNALKYIVGYCWPFSVFLGFGLLSDHVELQSNSKFFLSFCHYISIKVYVFL